MAFTLPEWQGLNIGALAGLFSNCTNSYKFLLFRAILEVLRQRAFDASEPISHQELAVEILLNAWYPHCFFKLSFGPQDQLARRLDERPVPVLKSLGKVDRKTLRAGIEGSLEDGTVRDLLRYVRFRLLTVFFEKDLMGLKDSQKDRVILELSRREFDRLKPLYRIDESAKAVQMHPDWVRYLAVHQGIVWKWAAWEWLQYMQRRNPNTPNLAAKLFPPGERQSLAQQTKFWLKVLDTHPLRCLYSGQPLTREDLSIDHFLPWTFMAHDELWNLVPAVASANSSKGDRIPADRYLEGFLQQQEAARPLLPGFRTFADEYVSALRLTDLSDAAAFRTALKQTVVPLMSLAASQGFAGGWEYRRQFKGV